MSIYLCIPEHRRLLILSNDKQASILPFTVVDRIKPFVPYTYTKENDWLWIYQKRMETVRIGLFQIYFLGKL